MNFEPPNISNLGGQFKPQPFKPDPVEIGGMQTRFANTIETAADYAQKKRTDRLNKINSSPPITPTGTNYGTTNFRTTTPPPPPQTEKSDDNFGGIITLAIIGMIIYGVYSCSSEDKKPKSKETKAKTSMNADAEKTSHATIDSLFEMRDSGKLVSSHSRKRMEEDPYNSGKGNDYLTSQEIINGYAKMNGWKYSMAKRQKRRKLASALDSMKDDGLKPKKFLADRDAIYKRKNLENMTARMYNR